MELDLVDGWDCFARRVGEELFEVLDSEVGDADILDFSGCGELLHLLPVDW